jgi:hypothetical protein
MRTSNNVLNICTTRYIRNSLKLIGVTFLEHCSHFKHLIKNVYVYWAQWFIPLILASWEAEIGRFMVQGQPR